MPAFFKMSEEKTTPDMSTVVIAEQQQPQSKARSTKKYVIIAVGCISAAAIILTAILVGMYIFSQSQMEIVKYTLSLDKNTKQDVTGDPNTNTVKYHVSSEGQEVWVVNDFNKDIQVAKVQTATGTNCYVGPLNRTAAMDPSKIAKPDMSSLKNVPDGEKLSYITSSTPISDTSFLSKAARDTCSGISTYWIYPTCGNPGDSKNAGNNPQRNKRACYYQWVTYRYLYCCWYYRYVTYWRFVCY